MKGILFKPDMIQAIVDGRKTQTRRVIKPQPKRHRVHIAHSPRKSSYTPDDLVELKDGSLAEINAPAGLRLARYQVGETVYIKEGIHRFNQEWASYDLDYTPVMFLQSANRFHWRWQKDYLSPLRLPYEAARHFILIEAVTAERLQEITPIDCENEGVVACCDETFDCGDARCEFRQLWDSINPEYPWENNPWVWVYQFRLFEK